MTLKSDIADVLKELDYTWFYGNSVNTKFPFIRFNLGNNYTDRLSNKKANRNIWYQVDVFTLTPLDVEGNNMLSEIENRLEQASLFTTDWLEATDTDNNTNYPVYHYFLEVRS